MKLKIPKLNVVKNSIWLIADKVISLASSAIIGIAIARHLGPMNFGYQNYAMALAALAAAVGGLGLNGILSRDLVYQPNDEGKILGTASIMTTVSSLLVTALVAVWVLTTSTTSLNISLLIVLITLATVLRRFEFLEGWFVVNNKVFYYARARVVVTLAFVVLRLALLLGDATVELFLIAIAAESACSGLRSVAAYFLVRDKKTAWEWSSKIALDSLKRSWPILLSGITAFIYLKVDVMMLTWWCSPIEAGIYSAAARLSEVWYVIPTLLMSAAFPEMLKSRKDDLTKYKRQMQQILDLFCAAGTIIALAVTSSAWWLVPTLYGKQFAGAALILTVHIWAGIFVFMRAVLSKWLIAEELYMFSLVTHGAGAIINVGLNLILIPKYGGLGAAIATLASYSTAGFFSLALHSRTIGMFKMMCLALCWPRHFYALLRVGR